MSEDALIYRIDSADAIVSVSRDWYAFANGNAWDSYLHPEKAVGHKLWHFIQGLETQYLYHELFLRVREGRPCHSVPFRCDSPRERRFLELVIDALPNGRVEFTSRLLRTEPRSRVRLLDVGRPKSSTDLLTICSMCKQIEVSPGQWAEIEDGLVRFRLFEAEKMPQLSHGLCHSCHQLAMQRMGLSATFDPASRLT